MSFEAAIYDILSGSASVTALIPAARIKPEGDWQNIPLPYAIYRTSSVDLEYMHEGRVGLQQEFFNVVIYHSDYKQAMAAARAVRDALDGHHVVSGNGLNCFLIDGPSFAGKHPDVNALGIGSYWRIAHAI